MQYTSYSPQIIGVSPASTIKLFFFAQEILSPTKIRPHTWLMGFPTVGWFIIPTNQTQIVLTIKNKTLLLLPNRYSQYEIHVCCAHNNLWIIV